MFGFLSTLRSILHQHRMILVQNDEENKHPITSCNNCKLPIASNQQFYKCGSRRCDFKIHKLCNEIPSEITHPRHPNHPLILQTLSRHSGTKCSCCQDTLTDMNIYRCEICPAPSFQVDIICAFLPEFRIEHRCHPQHPLMPTSEEALFLCQACGMKHQGRPFLCNLCGFWIDRSCARLPSILETNEYHHQHPLHLGYCLPADQIRSGSTCEICGHPINYTSWVYYCGECRYFAHVRCATSTTEPFMSIFNPARSRPVDFLHKNTIRLPVESESINLVRYLLKGSKRLNEPLEPGRKGPLDRFPEDDRGHRLFRHRRMPTKDSNDGSSNQERNKESNWSLCNGCIQPISPPFYSCQNTKCGFLVHAKCFEAPFDVHFGQKRLSFEGLNLKEFFGIFHCDACHRPCNGYYFRRSNGNRVLDMKCALTPEFIVHESHPKHRLILDKRRYGPCPCCLLSGEDEGGEYIYRCETCSFNLHPKCALYPSTVRHRYDKHPLKLTSKPIRGRISDEYYCEICELELNHHGWFYHCVECDQSFHVTCIPELDHLSNIKFGGTLKINFHVHPLTLDRIIMDRPCQYCNKTIDSITDGMAFQCKECPRYQIHFQCAKSVSLAQGQDIRECIFGSWDTGNLYSTGGELPEFALGDEE